jgi:hypothetical protein
MSSHGYLGDSGANFKPTHVYRCPRLGCKYETSAYTEAGMLRLADEHRLQHKREDLEREFKFSTFVYKRPEEYQKLKLTYVDMCFLVTRGIKVSEDVELDPRNLKPVYANDVAWSKLDWSKLI